MYISIFFLFTKNKALRYNNFKLLFDFKIIPKSNLNVYCISIFD